MAHWCSCYLLYTLWFCWPSDIEVGNGSMLVTRILNEYTRGQTLWRSIYLETDITTCNHMAFCIQNLEFNTRTVVDIKPSKAGLLRTARHHWTDIPIQNKSQWDSSSWGDKAMFHYKWSFQTLCWAIGSSEGITPIEWTKIAENSAKLWWNSSR